MTGPTGTQRGEAPEPGREGRVVVAAPKRQATRRAQRPRRPAHWTKKQVSTHASGGLYAFTYGCASAISSPPRPRLPNCMPIFSMAVLK